VVVEIKGGIGASMVDDDAEEGGSVAVARSCRKAMSSAVLSARFARIFVWVGGEGVVGVVLTGGSTSPGGKSWRAS
jgi:hypothetical protein